MYQIPGGSALAAHRAARTRQLRTRAGGAALLAGALGIAAIRTTEIGIAVAVATGLIGWALIRHAGRADVDRWIRGAAGETATAAVLASLPSRRWAVFHDLPIHGSQANIDHLAIGPTGVWVIDTKTTRTPIRTGWRKVYFGDRRLDPGPLIWESTIVSDRLGTAARPIVAVHGDGLRRRGGRARGVAVVPASTLRRRLTRGRRRLSRTEVADLAEVALSSFLVQDGPKRV